MNPYASIAGLDLDHSGLRHTAAPRGLVRVDGPDAAGFLHRLCSQEVSGLGVGATAPAAFLTPKGKLVATVWIGRLPDRLLLDCQVDQRAAIAELLERFHFSEKVQITAMPDFVCHELWGRGAERVCREVGGGMWIGGSWLGLHWMRVFQPADATPPWPDAPALGHEHRELLRILSGQVLVGVDVDATTLGPEAGLGEALCRTKGCYTGQEIVARIDTYGHVNRQLCLVTIAGEAAVAVGAALCDPADGEPVGRALSSAVAQGRRHALALVPADFARAGAALRLDGRAVTVERAFA